MAEQRRGRASDRYKDWAIAALGLLVIALAFAALWALVARARLDEQRTHESKVREVVQEELYIMKQYIGQPVTERGDK